MNIYPEIIKQAFIFFPLVAAFITLPYVAYNYHKYGSLFSLRIVIVYSFILYLLCTYFLIILPLPKIEEVRSLTSPRVQFILFHFIVDILKEANSLSLLHNRAFLQVAFNLLMTVPFGIYLRYYFKCNLKKTILATFGLSLFFELTQLSGLYFIYPRSYRLFDVDDLMINTLGGILGYFVAFPFLKILPSRKKLDDISFKRGQQVSFFRRLFAIIIDFICIGILWLIFNRLLHLFNLPLPHSLFLFTTLFYFLLLPVFWNGQTIGKFWNRMQIVSTTSEITKWYQYVFRYLNLFSLFLLCHWIPGNFSFLLEFIYSFYLIGMMMQHKTLFYEKWSKTQTISTIS